MSSPSADRPRGSSRGKRAAPKPPSRWSRRRHSDARTAVLEAPGSPPPEHDATTEQAVTAAETPVPRGTRTMTVLAVLAVVAGAGTLVVAAAGLGPEWLDGAGSTAVVTGLSWLLATRTAGRAVVASLLALALGLAAVLMGGRVLPTGAAVMTSALGGVYAVMVTTPAPTFLKAVRELLVATVVSAVTALAAIGFGPTVTVERFDVASLLVALVLVFAVVFRLGAGLHGLGRRGVLVVAVGLALMVIGLAYAELLRRYGTPGIVGSVLDFVDWTTERIGAFPRPLVALLGIPALLWGTFTRARRRQGWWVCAFGVAATVPMATALVDPASTFVGATLRGTYSLAIGIPLGYLVIRVERLVTTPKGARGRRAEEADAHRPEPSRFAEL